MLNGLKHKILWPNKLSFFEKIDEGNGVYDFIFLPKDSLIWKAGQFIDFNLGRGLTKHFTIASAPYEKTVNITTIIPKIPSPFKQKLLSLKKEDIILARNPWGELVIDSPEKQYVFIAGGIGITPFRAIIWDEVHKKSKTNLTLLYGCPNKKILFKKELDQFQKNKKIRVFYFIEPKRISEDILIQNIKENSIFHIAGPPAMVEHYYETLRKLGVHAKNIKTDPFWGY